MISRILVYYQKRKVEVHNETSNLEQPRRSAIKGSATLGALGFGAMESLVEEITTARAAKL